MLGDKEGQIEVLMLEKDKMAMEKTNAFAVHQKSKE
jgi:hypothetical protein